MKQIKFIILVLLFGFTSVALACGEKQESKRIKPIYPIEGMNYSEFSDVLLLIKKAINNEKILYISLHNSHCIYVKTGKVVDRLKGSGKLYIFQRNKDNWIMTHVSSWLS